MSERACGEALEETLGPSLERWTCVEEHREETALQLKRAGLDASGACGMKHSCGVDGTKRVKGAEAACRFGVVRKDAVVQGPVHVPTYVSALSRAAPHVPRYRTAHNLAANSRVRVGIWLTSVRQKASIRVASSSWLESPSRDTGGAGAASALCSLALFVFDSMGNA